MRRKIIKTGNNILHVILRVIIALSDVQLVWIFPVWVQSVSCPLDVLHLRKAVNEFLSQFPAILPEECRYIMFPQNSQILLLFRENFSQYNNAAYKIFIQD